MKNRRIGGIILTALLFAVALITIVPFIWMFISSFAPNSEIVKVTGGLFPKPSALANYVSIQEKFNFLRLFINSLVVAGLKNRHCGLYQCRARLRVFQNALPWP